jgi:hypothetical protein
MTTPHYYYLKFYPAGKGHLDDDGEEMGIVVAYRTQAARDASVAASPEGAGVPGHREPVVSADILPHERAGAVARLAAYVQMQPVG